VNPVDPVGDVGTQYHVQMINSGDGAVYTIYNQADGSVAAGPLMLGTGSCATGEGDGIVLYDRAANRWLLNEFANTGNHLCVYVSQTSDPNSGGWSAYDFTTPNFPDSPKYAVWHDPYYVTSNESGPSLPHLYPGPHEDAGGGLDHKSAHPRQAASGVR